MRARTIFLLLALMAVPAVSPAQSGGQAKAPPPNRGQELIEKAVEALGGDAYLNVTTITRQGRYYSFSRGELSSPGTLFFEYVRLPDKARVEFGKKRNIIYINNGDQGWELDPQGIREQTPEAIADFQQALQHDIDNLLRRRRTEPGVQFYYQGSQLMDNRRIHIVEMVDSESESHFFYLDERTHLPLQLRYRERDTLTGEVVEVVESYGIYLTFDGVKTPRQVSRERAGRKTFELFDIKAQYNPSLADTLFTRESLEEVWREISKKQKKKKKKKDEED